MELALCLIAGLLTVIIILGLKIYLLRKSAREIQAAFSNRLTTDTNTLISISSRDAAMRGLAASINVQLRLLRRERLRFQQGDNELKTAVTNISHDLRTPLTAINGYLDLLKDEDQSQETQRYLSVIENRIQTMTRLTEELFRYSIVTSTAGTLSYEEVNLSDALAESVSAFYAALKERYIQPEINLPDKPVLRMLDAQALSRIYGNIISNAIKYSDGDLKITLQENGAAVFSNHAHKLDNLAAAKFFDRFYTLETGRAATGLGLSIAKTLTEEMGGTISAVWKGGIIEITVQFHD
ncbi:sensor histidine kinase [Ihubacter sp. rT4E-8]|uniref:sensor histidine kinase n=1 Tax=unclassified Ihubacter TaxID=2633299 RepID=UPI003C7B9017